jgi:cobalt-zinc-cadmium efflux system outer membrane protein
VYVLAMPGLCLRCEGATPVTAMPRLSGMQHTILIDPRRGIGPEEAAAVAIIMNPALMATRDKAGLATAQLIQAGVLPNPQVTYEKDRVSGGATAGTQDDFTFSATWEVTSLLPLLSRKAAARANARALNLEIEWEEWQAAANAELAVYHVAALREELAQAQADDDALRSGVATMRKAVNAHEKTVLDLAANEGASEDVHATMLQVDQDLQIQTLALKRAMGIEPHDALRLRAGLLLPSAIAVPDEAALCATLDTRRIDLMGLQQGLVSQDDTVRAAVLAAFPKITAGFARNTDTTDVHTRGFSIQVDLPFFDRNQGDIAMERATRAQLRDEYADRLFEARHDIAEAIANIRSLNEQIAAAQEALPLLEKLVNIAGNHRRKGMPMCWVTTRRYPASWGSGST